MNLPAGHSLQNGKYQLQQVVGQGGFGITYKGILFTEVKGPLGAIKTEVSISIKEYFFKDYCYRSADGRTVSVHSTTGQQLFHKFKEKLIKEAKILSDVRYPYIVNVLDVFEENNTAYIAMEYISGHSLKYMLERDGILPEAKVLKYIHQIGNALRFVHEKNILHLDIKPSNILIDKLDNARLIDFGVSKRYDVEDKETSTTMLTLSKGFASIEQYDNEGTHTFSPCPDIYSLGATIYNLLTGRIPTESILRATRPLPAPSELNPSITLKTEEAIVKAMQINPSDRFQTIAEMMAALDAPPAEEAGTARYPLSDPLADNDESTIVYPPFPPRTDTEEDEQTLLHNPEHFPAAGKKKRRKVMLLIALICIFAAVGASLAFLVGNGSGQNSIVLPTAVLTDEGTAGDKGMAEAGVTENRNAASVVQLPERNPLEGNRQENTSSTTDEHLAAGVLSVPPTEEEKENERQALMTSGQAKMGAGNNTGARDDFKKAMSIKATDDLLQLWTANEAMIEKKEIADRLVLYEVKSSFGELAIVREKSTRKYGAIDEKGFERIRCKYVNVDPPTDEGRAFQREDKLYDIYNTNGVRVREGVTN